MGQLNKLRVLVYNIQNYEGNWPARLPIIAEAIEEAQVDIVVLNEVRGHYDGTANQAEEVFQEREAICGEKSSGRGGGE